MELKEINVPEGIIQKIDHERKFAGEINMERTRYLLNTDEMLEEWHSCTERK